MNSIITFKSGLTPYKNVLSLQTSSYEQVIDKLQRIQYSSEYSYYIQE